MDASKPMPVVMNWEERARRAEALADHLSLCAAKMAECASECEQHGHAGSLTREMMDRYHASRRYTENALARWASHRADLDCLEQEAAR